MIDYTITGFTVNDLAGLNNALQATTTKHVTFFVGRRGPFYLDYTPADFTTERVTADVQKQVQQLKDIDANLGIE
jgi:hypothetical protein